MVGSFHGKLLVITRRKFQQLFQIPTRKDWRCHELFSRSPEAHNLMAYSLLLIDLIGEKYQNPVMHDVR